ncbi:TetR/AcrR family transcriptional regulator [Amnibacterium sp.]|uniref:TetR/AcrR family transcriptional regulator n=1 Tax=Amnibacterium sp. TaxID=1872496 RepID=UPI00262FD3FA|nr:TetR/AcrR family transcriptional regulator [Amnibacterium sp.]
MTDLQEATRERARPMAPDDRRAAMIQAVIPLLKQHGRDVSTRQIAEACGVAEGTVFRAFKDKESLISAAIETYFDPLPLRTAIAGIAADLPVEQKLGAVLRLLRERFAGVIGLMSALRMTDAPPPPAIRAAGDRWMDLLHDLLAPNLDELGVPVELVAYHLRLVAFASSIPPFNVPHRFSDDELLALVGHGVLKPQGS